METSKAMPQWNPIQVWWIYAHFNIPFDKLEVKWEKAQLILSSTDEYAASSRTAITLRHCRTTKQIGYCMLNYHDKEVHYHKLIK